MSIEKPPIPHLYYDLNASLGMDYFWVLTFVVLTAMALYGAYADDHTLNIHLQNKIKLDELLRTNKNTDHKIDLILEKLN